MKTLDLIVNLILTVVFIGLAIGLIMLLFAMAKKSFLAFFICSTLTAVASFNLGKAMP
jgi:hypothetical protein